MPKAAQVQSVTPAVVCYVCPFNLRVLCTLRRLSGAAVHTTYGSMMRGRGVRGLRGSETHNEPASRQLPRRIVALDFCSARPGVSQK